MLYYPDEKLRLTSKKVVTVVPAIKLAIKLMQEEMQLYKGVGLAAIQINIPFQIILVENDVIIDPVVLDQSKTETLAEEGCLSLPQLYAKVSRPNNVMFMYTDENGESNIKTYSGTRARIFFHELDHLNGKLFIDRLSKTKRKKLLADYTISA